MHSLLADHWGELCASKEVASAWADQLLGVTREALNPERRGGFSKGTAACLSALFSAERFDELFGLLRVETSWSYKQWAVRAIAAQGHGYEITGLDVMGAYDATLKVAERLGKAAEVKGDIRKMLAGGGPGAGFVTQTLGRELRT